MFDNFRRYRLTFSYVAALAPLAYALWKRPPFIHWALALVVIGVILRIWAAGHITKNSVLAQNGPYALTRNPLYLGSFLSALGVFTVVQAWALLGLFLPLYFLFYGSTIASEQRYLRMTYGEDYDLYCKMVPVFFPRLIPARTAQSASFSLRKAFFYNKEIISTACTVLEVGLVYLTLCFP